MSRGATTVRLDPATIESITRGVATRVAELLAVQRPLAEPLKTAAEMARDLGTSPGWVRSHADELGAIPLGDGPKAPLRFDPVVARERLEARRARRPPDRDAVAASGRSSSRQRKSRATGRRVPLLSRKEDR